MIVITSGKKYIDIDAYAGCIAYATLLNALGTSAKAVTTTPFNESISKNIRVMDLRFDNYVPMSNDQFIILDVSDPEMFDECADLERIIEVIDHHTGHEDYWQAKQNVKSQIEFIGSVGTIIYERFAEQNKTNVLTQDLCKLLTAAILDNTLNLKASITTQRDIDAYNKLMKIGNTDKTWSKEYFEDCERDILSDLETAIKNDTKLISDPNLPYTFGQLTIYDEEKILRKIDAIRTMFASSPDWMMNVISLKSGKAFILSSSSISKMKLEKLFNKQFQDDIMVLDKFMLRKEIIKKAQESSKF